MTNHQRHLPALGLALLVIGAAACAAADAPEAESPAPRPTTVLFFGDSITLKAIQPENGLSDAFQAINWGTGGIGTYFGFRIADKVFRDHGNADVVSILLGTNDAYTARVPVEEFERDLGLIVDLAQEAGLVVQMPTIPFSPAPELADVPLYNEAIARVRDDRGCVAGPDFYQHFLDHPDHLEVDLTHPTQAGLVAMNEAWASSIAALSLAE